DIRLRLRLSVPNFCEVLSITIGSSSYRVRSILKESSGFSPVSPDTAVVVSESSFEAEIGTETPGYSTVVVETPSGSQSKQVADSIRHDLNSRTKTVEVTALSSITDSISEFFSILNKFLIGIGGISMVVAGVSILNVMMMSTVERKGEIGVLRAVGGEKREVLKMLLIESSLLGVGGGILGVILSIILGLGIYQITLNSPLGVFGITNLLYMSLAFVFGVVTSLISAAYPAWKAANEDPVDALHG
ncbi:MAG: ABC transporter permease, partial [Halobacteria archaeon]|nr:ABC transporter permease [Halobacteria archaeon]